MDKKMLAIVMLLIGTTMSVAEAVRSVKEWRMARKKTKQLQEELLRKERELQKMKKMVDDLINKEMDEVNKLGEVIVKWKEIPNGEMTVEKELKIREALNDSMKLLGM